VWREAETMARKRGTVLAIDFENKRVVGVALEEVRPLSIHETRKRLKRE
jgi:hypothetical protein